MPPDLNCRKVLFEEFNNLTLSNQNGSTQKSENQNAEKSECDTMPAIKAGPAIKIGRYNENDWSSQQNSPIERDLRGIIPSTKATYNEIEQLNELFED